MLFLRVLVALGARIPVLLYRDRFCAVNKPPGISTHRSRETGRRRVVTTHLQRQLRRKVYTVHRLDHRTSGALLFGFDGEAAGECHARLRAGRKEYLALLRGCDWPNDDGADVVVDRDVKGDDGVPRAALTTFRRLASQEEPRCTLCIASPATGRPHQIRRARPASKPLSARRRSLPPIFADELRRRRRVAATRRGRGIAATRRLLRPRAVAVDADCRRFGARRLQGQSMVARGARPRSTRAALPRPRSARVPLAARARGDAAGVRIVRGPRRRRRGRPDRLRAAASTRSVGVIRRAPQAITLPDPETPIVAPIEGSLADVLRSEPLWADALAREPRLRLAPVDDRSGSNG